MTANPYPVASFVAPTSSRPLHPTMGQGVAERTYLRRVFDGHHKGLRSLTINPRDPKLQKWLVAAHNSDVPVQTDADAPLSAEDPVTRWEAWHEVGHRVALGNVSLLLDRARLMPYGERGDDEKRDAAFRLWQETATSEYALLSQSIAKGALLMSGRHLQQGDKHQPDRNLEVFSNCSTACTSFALFMLLLNGSGVGRDYSDRMMVVDWAGFMPNIVSVMADTHPDFVWGKHTTPREAEHLYRSATNVYRHVVEDSREGWAKAVEVIEMVAYRNQYPTPHDRVIQTVIFDFSKVRAKGQPIMGMQGRPSSGPVPLMDAFDKITKIRGTGLKPWLATLYIDHYLAEPVLVGGARRSARMSTKDWRDPDIIEFIGVKRPVEFDGLSMSEVEMYRAGCAATGLQKPMSFLWSSNNSVAVDADFWARVKGPITGDQKTQHAKMVYEHACACAYGDGTGEPGFINVDRLSVSMKGFGDQRFEKGDWFGSKKYKVAGTTKHLLAHLFQAFGEMPYHFIVNPCGEIVLSILGGFCVIADAVPFHADTLDEALEVGAAAARALIRVNLMDSVYGLEVARTNRIGVGITGVHEFAWKFFRIGFRDMINPDFDGYDDSVECATSDNPRVRAAAFWDFLGAFARHVRASATEYAKTLGVVVPHTFMTVKPSGSVSKLFGLTEGWHLPAMRHYMRWVQYHKDSPMIAEYRAAGYRVRELKTYRDHFIVGFPTEPTVCGLDGIDPHLVTAGEASPEDQFMWLRLGEFFLMEGGSAKDFWKHSGSVTSLASPDVATGNQISYTLKYDPTVVSFADFKDTILRFQPYVRCASVLPLEESSSYEYLPEEQISLVDYHALVAAVRREDDTPSEDIGMEHLDCSTGACPISFTGGDKADL